MGQSRRDKSWPKPARTRHAWLREGTHPHDVPRQVFVIEWRRHSYRWSALVVYVVDGDHGPVLVQHWVLAESLKPVPADPNRPRGW